MNGQNIVNLYMGCLLGEKLSDAALKRLAQANEQMLQVTDIVVGNSYAHGTALQEPTQEKLC